MPAGPKERRAARHAPPGPSAPEPTTRRLPITVDRITDAALEVVATQGYDALTMRSVAARLGTGPASLYAHVVNKADLDELVIGRLCSRLVLPQADPTAWRGQVADVCVQLRDQYLAHPGISRAAFAMEPTNLDVLRVTEGMLAVLTTGGVAPQRAAWAADALLLYVGAYALEHSLVAREERADLVRRFSALPADRFPQTRRHAAELTSGTGHERFDFTVDLVLGTLG